RPQEVPARQQEGLRTVQQLHLAAGPAVEATHRARCFATLHQGTHRASRRAQGRSH
ncbi:hypothetical protein BN1723_020158, partial [Verticillium longisporum]